MFFLNFFYSFSILLHGWRALLQKPLLLPFSSTSSELSLESPVSY
jgi:hypothetical protein